MSGANDLERESTALAARRAEIAERTRELEAHERDLVRKKRLHERALVALDRRGLVGAGALGAVLSSTYGWRVGHDLGMHPDAMRAGIALALAVAAVAVIVVGRRQERREARLLAEARAGTETTPVAAVRVAMPADAVAEAEHADEAVRAQERRA